MAIWPLLDGSLAENAGSLTATSNGTTVTADTVAHTKGVWAELITSTTFSSRVLTLIVGATSANATDSSTLLDIAIGGSGSEVVVVANLSVGGYTASFNSLRIPLRIPAGTRIAVRIQSATVSKTLEVVGILSGGGFIPFEAGGLATTYGANTATSGGVTLATPGATNTKTTWTEVTSATTARGRFLLLTLAKPTGAADVASSGLLDIGVGASSSEVVIASNIPYQTNASELLVFAPILLPVRIPEGARIAVRQQSSATSASAKPRPIVTLFS